MTIVSPWRSVLVGFYFTMISKATSSFISPLLDRLSKNSGCQYVRVSYDNACWARENSGNDYYSVVEIIEMISVLIGNSYIKAFGKIFKQSKGIG